MLHCTMDWLSDRHWGEPEMSDLESVRPAHDTTITAVAGGKLRALADASGLQLPGEGLLDAFAEVFARMSEVSTVAVRPDEPSLPDEAPELDAEQEEESEPEPQPDEILFRCVGVKQEDYVVEEVEMLSSSPSQAVVITEAEVIDANESDELVSVDAATLVTAPVVAEVTVQETEEVELREQPERHALPRDEAPGGRERRRKTEPTNQVKPDVKPIQRSQDPVSDTAGQVDPEGLTEETDRFSDPQGDDTSKPLRRSRRNQHHQGRGLQQGQPPVTQSGQRAVGTIELPSGSAVTDAASGTDPLKGISPERRAAVANRISQGPVVASPATAQPSRSGNSAGSGTREGVFNLPLDSVSKSANRPVADSRGHKGDKTHTLTRIKLIQRVSKAFQHLGTDGGVVRLRLAPADMGSVRVEMRIQNRKIAARVVAETEAASAALREHLPDLRARLESFGMHIEQLDIEMEAPGQDAGSPFEDAASQDEQWKEPQQRSRRGTSKPEQPDAVADVSQIVPHRVVPETPATGIDVHL